MPFLNLVMRKSAEALSESMSPLHMYQRSKCCSALLRNHSVAEQKQSVVIAGRELLSHALLQSGLLLGTPLLSFEIVARPTQCQAEWDPTQFQAEWGRDPWWENTAIVLGWL